MGQIKKSIGIESFRQRYSPLVLIAHDAELDSVYKDRLSFYDFLEKAFYFGSQNLVGTASGQFPKLRLRRLSTFTAFSVENLRRKTKSIFSHCNSLKTEILDKETILELCIINGIEETRAIQTFDHPIACIHASFVTNANPINWLLESQKQCDSMFRSISSSQNMILHFFVLVADEKKSNSQSQQGLVAEVHRIFGHNSYFLTLNQSKHMHEDSAIALDLLLNFSHKCLYPYMKNFLVSASPITGVSNRNHWIAGKIWSASKRFLGPVIGQVNQSQDSEELRQRIFDFAMFCDESGTYAGDQFPEQSPENYYYSLLKNMLSLFHSPMHKSFLDFTSELSEEIVKTETFEKACDLFFFTLLFSQFELALHQGLGIFDRILILSQLDPHLKCFTLIYTSKIYLSLGRIRHALINLYYAIKALNDLDLTNLAQDQGRKLERILLKSPIKLNICPFKIEQTIYSNREPAIKNVLPLEFLSVKFRSLGQDCQQKLVESFEESTKPLVSIPKFLEIKIKPYQSLSLAEKVSISELLERLSSNSSRQLIFDKIEGAIHQSAFICFRNLLDVPISLNDLNVRDQASPRRVLSAELSLLPSLEHAFLLQDLVLEDSKLDFVLEKKYKTTVALHGLIEQFNPLRFPTPRKEQIRIKLTGLQTLLFFNQKVKGIAHLYTRKQQAPTDTIHICVLEGSKLIYQRTWTNMREDSQPVALEFEFNINTGPILFIIFGSSEGNIGKETLIVEKLEAHQGLKISCSQNQNLRILHLNNVTDTLMSDICILPGSIEAIYFPKLDLLPGHGANLVLKKSGSRELNIKFFVSGVEYEMKSLL